MCASVRVCVCGGGGEAGGGYYIIERHCGLGEDTQFTCSSGRATAARRTMEESDGSGTEEERVGPNSCLNLFICFSICLLYYLCLHKCEISKNICFSL